MGQVGSLADLTGGMGIDSLLFASAATLVDYVEQDAQLVDMMRHNAAALGLDNVAVHCSDCVGWLGCSSRRYDWLYIDPSRRDSYGRRTVRLEDCQPDIVKLLPLLKGRCAKLARLRRGGACRRREPRVQGVAFRC